jgi:hypothetical protein
MAPREFGHRRAVAADAERFDDEFVAGVFPTDGLGAAFRVAHLAAETFERAPSQTGQDGDFGRLHLPRDLAGPASELEQGVLFGQVLQVPGQVGQEHHRLGPMPRCGRDVLPSGEQDRMEDDAGEMRVGVVLVGLPIGGPEMDLDVAADAPSVDLQFRAQEVGSRAPVPVAGSDDLDRLAARRGHRAGDLTRSPDPLDGAFPDGEGAVRTFQFFDAIARAHADGIHESVAR